MLYISISLIIGVVLGCIATVFHLKKSHIKLLDQQKNDFLQKISEHESSHNQLSSELHIIKSDANNQKEAAEQKIGEAFQAGSEMMEEMSASLGRIQVLVTNASEPIQHISETGNQAQDMIHDSRSAIEKMSSSLTELNDISVLVNELCENMNQVNEKTEAIHNIANQANLLSLNASIEAARAGEAGRGFSVVANDMNRLSELSAIAAQDISKILSTGIKNIQQITVDMDDKIENFTNVSNDVLGCFEKMGGSIESINELTESLSADSTVAVENVKTVGDTTQTTMESLTKIFSDVTNIISGNTTTDVSPTK